MFPPPKARLYSSPASAFVHTDDIRNTLTINVHRRQHCICIDGTTAETQSSRGEQGKRRRTNSVIKLAMLLNPKQAKPKQIQARINPRRSVTSPNQTQAESQANKPKTQAKAPKKESRKYRNIRRMLFVVRQSSKPKKKEESRKVVKS